VTDVNALDSYGDRALARAVGEKQKEAVQILLENGADPNLREEGEESCLHRAAKSRDNGAIITALAEHGADLNALDDEGRTPLDRAIEYGRKSNAELLRGLGGKRG
jgi:uncharacterized protein